MTEPKAETMKHFHHMWFFRSRLILIALGSVFLLMWQLLLVGLLPAMAFAFLTTACWCLGKRELILYRAAENYDQQCDSMQMQVIALGDRFMRRPGIRTLYQLFCQLETKINAK